MENCKVSVIVPVYKCQEYLERCVNSIINQTYQNLEIILVDDGSPDNSGAICDEFFKKDKRIKVVHQINSGVSVARNNGLKEATGKWVSFIDSDDYIEPNMYSEMVYAGEKNEVDLVLSDLSITENGRKLDVKINLSADFKYGEKEIREDILPRFTFGGKENIGLFAPTTKLYKRQVITDNQVYFVEGLSWSEDTLFVVEFLANTKSLYYIPKEFYVYVPMAGGLYSRFNKNSYLESVKIYKLFNALIEKYNIVGAKKESLAESFIYQISWFLYRTTTRIEDKKERKALCNAVVNNDGVIEVIKECLPYLTSFDLRMAKGILKGRRRAMFIIDFVYSGKKDKLMKLLKRG